MAVQREYLSPNEIAEVLGVSPFTIRRYIKLGELRAVKLLGGFRVHRDDLQHFLKAHEVNPAEEELQPEEAAAAAPDPNMHFRLAAPPQPLAAPEEPPETHPSRKRAVKHARRR
jgi:excisionase family DNA binding protein